MFKMQPWQYVVVAMVGIACVGYMSVTVARMFGRPVAGNPAVLREATAFESANVQSEPPAGAQAFDAFSYRVPGRFAGRVRITVDSDRISIAGPRVPAFLYRAWIWAQAMLLALVPAALVAAALQLNWRWLATAIGLFVAGQLISALGAGVWPGLGEVEFIEAGRFRAIEFGREQVRDVKIGEGWADGGIDLVLLPVKGGIDGLAANRAVSFFAPDETGRDVRYALHMTSEADASELAGLLR